MLSDKIDFISIQAGEDKWVERIEEVLRIDRLNQCLKNKEFITNGGYNIKKEAPKLEDLYLQE